MDGDRPISRIEDDRLGFAPIAKQLASSIMDRSAQDGLVFGVEGEWGSGKSTLINLTIASLRALPNPPDTVEFSPWLVGSRDDLLAYLFDEIASAAARILPAEPPSVDHDTLWQRLTKRIRPDKHTQLRRKQAVKEHAVVRKLRAFGGLSGGLAKALKAAGAAGVPLADVLGTGIEKFGEGAAGLFESTSLAKRKLELVAALRLLPRRIVVFVDDLDRLEPQETAEVLRLIRAVADFPNVIYVISCDVDVVAQTLQSAIKVADGKAFLEKIIQVSFKVPRPEAFDLRRWFRDEVHALFGPETTGSTLSSRRVHSRLALAIDSLGGRYLKTPRDVIRALNALRLHAVPVRTHIDLADMVWLQLVRTGNPDLYSWVEEYLTETSAIYGGARIDGNDAQRMSDRLDEILRAEREDVDRSRIELGSIIPGLHTSFAGNGVKTHHAFHHLTRDEFIDYILDRRLASPEHYRYYFAFTLSAGSLRDDEVRAFIALAEYDVPAAIQKFSELVNQKRPQGGVMAELLIDRLDAARQQIPEAAIPGIFACLSATMDTLALSSRDGDFGQHRAWGAAERLVDRLMKPLAPVPRQTCLRHLFATGPAIGWQTSLLRSETFAHGHFGDRPQPEDRRLLSTSEYEQAKEMMLARFANVPPDQLLAAPNLLSLLYGWEQASGRDDAKEWARANTRSDTQLLTFLSRARGWSSVAAGVIYPLKRHDIGHFIDYQEAVDRVRGIMQSPHASQTDKDLAAELLRAFEQGQRD